MDKHWTEVTEEEFCLEKLLENSPEKNCEICNTLTQFWTDDMGGILCIDCSHEQFCNQMNDAMDASLGRY